MRTPFCLVVVGAPEADLGHPAWRRPQLQQTNHAPLIVAKITSETLRFPPMLPDAEMSALVTDFSMKAVLAASQCTISTRLQWTLHRFAHQTHVKPRIHHSSARRSSAAPSTKSRIKHAQNAGKLQAPCVSSRRRMPEHLRLPCTCICLFLCTLLSYIS